ncbi:MAG: hypothetical protein HFF17_02755 [Oscillospiraceae bacterium]|nr:hypothetical protein [Oscillospiraceae bacterium]
MRTEADFSPRKAVLDLLRREAVDFTCVCHPPVYTMEEMRRQGCRADYFAF